jgi:endonuclease/exonuclease/phosphatase (EEP) superfamily protein YafD
LFQNTIRFAFVCLLSINSYAAFVVPDDSTVLRTIEAGQPTETMPNQFNMLVWNVHKGSDKEAWANDLFRFKHYESILIEEFVIDDFMPGVVQQLSPLETIMAVSFINTTAPYTTGVATSLIAKSNTVSYRRSPDREPVIDTPKMILMNEVTLTSGKQLLILNIHAINFVTTATFENQINDILPFIAKYQGNVIFAGDFNTWSSARTGGRRHRVQRCR